MSVAPRKPRDDSAKSKAQLVDEVRRLLARVEQLQQAEVRWRQAEEALRENRLRLGTVVSDAPIILWKFDRDGVFTFIDGRGLQTLGMKASEVVGTSAFDHFADSPRVQSFIRRALRGKPVREIVEFRGRSYEVRCEPFYESGEQSGMTGVIGVSTDITEQREAAECLRLVIEKTSAATGKGFFRSLAQHLAEAMHTRGALVCEVVDVAHERLAPLAIWIDGTPGENLPYMMSSIPCREVVRHGMLHVPCRLQDRFPHEAWIAQAGVESYLGVALIGSTGQVIGSLSVIDDKPLDQREFAEPILRVFAVRAAAELERQRADDAIRESQRQLLRQNQALARLSKLEAIGEGDLQKAVMAITETAAHTLETQRVNVWFYDEHELLIHCIDQFELNDRRHSEGYELTANEFPSYFKALEERRIIAAADATTDSRTREFTEPYLKPNGIGALLDAPIRVAGRMIGVICHEHVGSRRDWTLEEEQFAASMADYVALAIEARDRRCAEDALRQARNELEQRVKERTARLTQTNRRLRTEIVERRKTEAALRRSEARFRRLFESNIIGVVFAHVDGPIIDANEAFLRMLGYDRDDLPINWEKLTPEEWVPENERRLKELLVHGVASPWEKECFRKDGSRVPVYIGTAQMDDEPGLCVAFVVDLTERKRAERALAQSEDRLRSLVSTAPDFILVLDKQDRIQFINRRMTATPDNQILGANAFDFAVPEHRDRMRRCIDRVWQTGEFETFDIKAIVETNHGATWYTVRVGPFVQDNHIAGVTLIARDVTEAKRIEKALRESETKFRQLAETVASAAFIFQGEKIRYVNRAATHITGYSEQELLKMRFFEVVHPEHRELTRQRGLTRQQGASLPPRYEVKVLRKDGAQRWIDFVAAEIQYEGRPAVLGTAFDITDRKEAEKELLSKQEFLKRLLAAHERERQLTAYEVHDGLAQDIAAAKMHLEAFRRKQTVMSNRGAQEFGRGLELLSSSIGEARRLVSGLRPPIIDEHGVVAAIDYLINERNAAAKLDIDFVHDVQFDRLDPMIEGAVFRIVQEALTNVVRHSKAKRAAVTLKQIDGRMQIEIRDWGIGFHLEKVAENRFGLQGIRERARLYQGRATIKSRPGEGTRIAVELPIQHVSASELDRSGR